MHGPARLWCLREMTTGLLLHHAASNHPPIDMMLVHEAMTAAASYGYAAIRHAGHRGPGEARFGLRVGTRQNSRWRTGPDHPLDLRYGIKGAHNEGVLLLSAYMRT
jgi:hypothetical protein